MRIPTIVGVVAILLAISLVVSLTYNQKISQGLDSPNLAPQDIQVANITDSSATVTWQTTSPTKGQVMYGSEGGPLNINSFDDRDQTPKERLTHFVTLSNLSPESSYQFKVGTDYNHFPDKPLTLKTSSQRSTNDSKILPLKQPIQGSVIESPQKPLDEGLVFLKISGASILATTIGESGNFLLSLKELRKQDLQGFYNLSPKTEGSLVIQKGSKSSLVQIILPPSNQPIPTIVLGQSLDLRQYPASPSARLSTLSFDDSPFDLNLDGAINSLDLAFVLDNVGKTNADKKADLNKDNKVNQADVDLLKKQIK